MVKICLLSRCPAGTWTSNIPHAHSFTVDKAGNPDPDFGTICINPGEPMGSILHELAHIQAPDDAHGSVWCERMKALRLDPYAFYFRP